VSVVDGAFNDGAESVSMIPFVPLAPRPTPPVEVEAADEGTPADEEALDPGAEGVAAAAAGPANVVENGMPSRLRFAKPVR